MAFRELVFLSTILAVCLSVSDKEYCKPIEWTGGTFGWSNDETQKIYRNSGRAIKKNAIATRAQVYGDDVLLALPRYKPGVPATLAVLHLKQDTCESKLYPFPCWSQQEEGSCDSLQSVVDIFIDAQDVIWALDVGVVNTLETPVRRCPPKIQAFSLKTGKLLKTLDLSGLVAQASRLQYIVVEYSSDGKPYVYVSDAATRSIIVFDVAGNKGYRVVLPKAVVAGASKRDVLYTALVRKGCGNNYLVFTYLSSGHVFSIRTDYLRSGSAAGRVVDLGVKPSKIVFLGTDLGSAIFFRYEGFPEVYRWDVNTCFKKENFALVYKSQDCLLATQAMADVKRNRIRVLESNFPDFIQNTVGCGAVQQINVMAGCTKGHN